MMAATTVIPSADKALLAAQASAGAAGVDAYEAAKKELAAQQAAAVTQALVDEMTRNQQLVLYCFLQSLVSLQFGNVRVHH